MGEGDGVFEALGFAFKGGEALAGKLVGFGKRCYRLDKVFLFE